MILFIHELLANVKRFSFHIEPSSEHLIYGVVCSELYLSYFFKMNKKNEIALNIIFSVCGVLF